MIRKKIIILLTMALLMLVTGCNNDEKSGICNPVSGKGEAVNDIQNKSDQNNIIQNKNIPQKNSVIEIPKRDYEELQLDIKVADMLEQMSLEEKVAQMFIVLSDSLGGDSEHVTMTTELTKQSIDRVPVGGVVYMGENLIDPEQVKTMLNTIQGYSIERVGLPLFLCVDEEGGRIARVANNSRFMVDNVGSMTDIGNENDHERAYEAGAHIGEYLSELGFNLDFAPVADVGGNMPGNVLYRRTLSDDPYIVSDLADAVSKGLNSKGIISVYKHFPGHGSTKGDPHKGYAVSDKTKEELAAYDLIPFKKAIDENVMMIMVGHISMPNVTEDGIPASLSKEVVTNMLRNDMGYDGVIMTDAMNMRAIKDNYDADEAALRAVKAGVDIVLMPNDLDMAYKSILNAVKNGDLSVDRIDESVTRIIKLKMGFLN